MRIPDSVRIPPWARYVAADGNRLVGFTSSLHEAYELLRGKHLQQVYTLNGRELKKYRGTLRYGKKNPERLSPDRAYDYEAAGFHFGAYGAGSTSYTIDPGYFGFAVTMRPRTFLSLAYLLRHPSNESFEFMRDARQNKEMVAPPFLSFIRNPSSKSGKWQCTGHEGRHRMTTILHEVGNYPVPVVIVIRDPGETRARNITDEAIKTLHKGSYSEDGIWISGPLFASDYAIVNGRKVILD